MKEQQSAVIMEIRGRSAAALTATGSFIRVPNEGYEVGQTIQLRRTARQSEIRIRFTAYASVAAGFLMLLFGGWVGYTTPAGVVSLDVNPSIEYSINYFDRVLDITAVNDDGSAILSGLDLDALRYRPVDEAVEATITELRAEGYLSEKKENDVMLSASTGNARHAEQLAERLYARVSQQSDLTVYSVPVSKDAVESAHSLGTSAGKYYLIEQLKESTKQGESFDPEDWVEKPVREIIAKTKEHPTRQNDLVDESLLTPEPSPTPVLEKKQESGSTAKPEGSVAPIETPKPNGQSGEKKDDNGNGNSSSSGVGRMP